MPTPTTILPADPALEYRFMLPDGWRQVEVPAQTPDFNDPNAFLSLGLFVDAEGTSLFSVAMRPAYADGTVLDWLRYHTAKQNFKVEQLCPIDLAALTGASALATQSTEAGPVKLRLVLVEDGARLVTLTLLTPLHNWPSLENTFDHMLASFILRHVQGPTIPLSPEAG